MLPVCEPNAIRDDLRRLLEALPELVLSSDAAADEAAGQASVSVLATALEEALDALARRIHADCSPESDAAAQLDLDRLGDHVVDLMQRLGQSTGELGAESEARELDGLLLALACCLVRSGGELSRLQPVVDAATKCADRERDPAQMRLLFHMTDDIARGLSPRFSGSPEGGEDFEQWRALLITRAVIATRTLEPALMEQAFDALLEELPADAPGFFREGLRRMALANYPSAVREVMHRYHNTRSGGERMH